jgi:hypothetical protein
VIQPSGLSMTGRWTVSFEVTEGNDKDRARIRGNITIECAQNTTVVICRGAEPPGPAVPIISGFNGTINGASVTFDESSASFPQTGVNPGYCWYNIYGGYTCVGPSTYTVQNRLIKHMVGTSVRDGLIQGQWTGFLYVGLGKYPVAGTWTAIRI